MKNKNKMTLQHKKEKKPQFLKQFFVKLLLSALLFFALFFGSNFSDKVKNQIDFTLTQSTDMEKLKSYADFFIEQSKKVDLQGFLEKNLK